MNEPRINKKIIKLFLDLGRELFPLCRDVEYGEELPVKLAGKKPLHKNWRTRTYDYPTLLEFVGRGHNLGWKIGPGDLVIDVDPRNGGDKGLKVLLRDVGVDDLGDLAPTVLTGGGGTHYYFRLPDDVPKLRKKSERYPGVDFQRSGSYVVIPGSYHYLAENLYSWDDMSPLDLPSPQLPEVLLSRLSYSTGSKPSTSFGEDPELTPEELGEILKQIPVEEYGTNDQWFEILASSHYATAGEGYEVFLRWSLEDPRYADDEDVIRVRWNSLGNGTENPVTTATLYKNLNLWGGVPPRDDALTEFGAYLDSSDVVDKVKNVEDSAPNSLRTIIDGLDDESNSRQVNRVLKECLRLNPVQVDIIIRDISKRTKISKSSLKEQLSELRGLRKKGEPKREENLDDADLRDLVQQVTAVLLREKYDNGRRLRFLDDGRFWFYDGKKWSPYFNGLIERDIYEAILTLRVEVPDIDFDAARVMAPVERILRAKTASPLKIYDPTGGRPSIINLDNCELWINPTDGKLRKRKHSPESNLTYCLDISLDLDAECPLFDRTLDEIFANEKPKDRENIIRHLWEMFGYIIQPNKNIASWFLFLGTGANGKTLVLEVLSALLGSAVLEQSITDFAPNRPFAKSALPGKLLVIDDDVSAKTILPDDFMKKVSENKFIVADQKYGPSIRFRSTASVLLSSNSIPGTKDVSYGMLRRAMLIPFRRQFSRLERDYNRGKDIVESELPGILVAALRGLKRLRERGDFRVPRICSDLRDVWRDDANPLFGFLAECFERDNESKIGAPEIWSLYSYWTTENGIGSRYALTKRSLYKSLVDMGFAKFRGTGGKIFFQGLRATFEIEEVDE